MTLILLTTNSPTSLLMRSQFCRGMTRLLLRVVLPIAMMTTRLVDRTILITTLLMMSLLLRRIGIVQVKKGARAHCT
jgi:hypothetical protein